MAALIAPLLLGLAAQPPVVVVDRDGVEITESCTVRVEASPIPDADGDGVVRITGDGLTVVFEEAPLRGAPPDRDPDACRGVGVRITGRNVTLRGARISGFKAAVHASGADGLVIEDCDVSDNFRQRLASTPQAESTADWLRPHRNDANEWLENYGAGIYVEDSNRIAVRRVRARRVQNGIVLDGVNESEIYDNDCSFLSGWGLALWRSNRNLISRNAFDFCVRGYSHGVYNRGQDSAGILLFEQCSENVIAENSATHGGDGLFCFAGNEALGREAPRDDDAWYARRGCNGNTITGNDFSDCAAHGVEVTFSFGNRITLNRITGNAICGIWGGYSQRTAILGNEIAANGGMPYGAEHGGVNIEHGRLNRIVGNRFENNTQGVYLWWDDDAALLETPWAKVNRPDSTDNAITGNRFVGSGTAVRLRRTDRTELANEFRDVGVELDADEQSLATLKRSPPEIDGALETGPDAAAARAAVGDSRPVGARAELRGREHIVMTEWGPYDWQAPLLLRVQAAGHRHVYRLLGAEPAGDAALRGPEALSLRRGDGRLSVESAAAGTVLPYELRVETAAGAVTARDALLAARWDVLFFASAADPRQAADAWRRDGRESGVRVVLDDLDLRYGTGGPGDVAPLPEDAALPADRFGTIASTTVTFPAGRWRIRTTSDDGIRVWFDEQLLIDDWTWHPPKTHVRNVEIGETRPVNIRVEHFELDGHAILTLDVEPLD